jgi:hypothetical protein
MILPVQAIKCYFRYRPLNDTSGKSRRIKTTVSPPARQSVLHIPEVDRDYPYDGVKCSSTFRRQVLCLIVYFVEDNNNNNNISYLCSRRNFPFCILRKVGFKKIT